MTTEAKKPIPVRLILLMAMLIALVAFGPDLTFQLKLNRELAAAVPDEDFVDSVRYESIRLEMVLLAFWDSGKIAHRQEAIGILRFPATRELRLNPPPCHDRILREGVVDRDAIVREHAIYAMHQFEHPDFERHLLNCLADPDAHFRIIGMRMLRHTGRTNAIHLVADQLDTLDRNVICEAVNWLQIVTGKDHGMSSLLLCNRRVVTEGKTADWDAKFQAAVTSARDWWKQEQPGSASALKAGAIPDHAPGPPVPLHELPVVNRNGNPIDWSRYDGKPLLLYFHTAWRASSGREIRPMQELQARAGERLSIIGVSVDAIADEHNTTQHADLLPGAEKDTVGFGHGKVLDETNAHAHSHDHEHAHPQIEFSKIARRVLQQAYRNKFTFPIVFDVESTISRYFQGGEVPAFVLLDEERRIIRRFTNERSATSILAMAGLDSLDE
ncbi:MAG: hypothetical protein CMO80_02755 [Verrucomicrobiales bacterium]|nr:hypothetical protein [Verrucomicrobiales bacterium]